MPTTTSTVGGATLPLPAGALNSAIDDPTVSGLAAYLRHWIRSDINAKLANLQGTSPDAVPAANVFHWNPLQPSALFTRGAGDGAASPFPALYVWGGRGKLVEQTTLHHAEEREIGVLWLFDELALPGALVDRYGLRNAVAKALERAISLRYHPTFDGGTPIAVSLRLSGRGVVLSSCEPGMLSPIPATVGRGEAADQPAVHAYPAVSATLLVWERVEAMQPESGDVGDVYAADYVGSADVLAPMAVGERVLPTT